MALVPGRVQLFLPACRDDSFRGACEAFIFDIKCQLEPALGEHIDSPAADHRAAARPGRAAAATRDDILVQEANVSAAEAQLAEHHDEVVELQAALRVVFESAHAFYRDHISFTAGDALVAPHRGPLVAIAASASGRFVATACANEAVLTEATGSGFSRIAARAATEFGGGPLTALRFLDEDSDASALLLAAGDLCLGWDAPAAGDGGEAELFLRVRATRGRIVDMAAARGCGSSATSEKLLLGTEQCAIEVYDLQIYEQGPPIMLFVVSIDGYLHAAVFASTGTLVVAAYTNPEGEAMLHFYDVNLDGHCVAELRPEQSGDGVCASLAYSASEELLALGVSSGSVQLYSSEDVGAAIATASVVPERSTHLARKVSSSHNDLKPALAWLEGHPQLAVGMPCRPEVVLVYTYRRFPCVLELAATLRPFNDGKPPRSLAWAPGFGALLVAYGCEWQFWLMGTQRACPTALGDDPAGVGPSVAAPRPTGGGAAGGGAAGWLARLEREEEAPAGADEAGILEVGRAEEEEEEEVALFREASDDNEEEGPGRVAEGETWDSWASFDDDAQEQWCSAGPRGWRL